MATQHQKILIANWKQNPLTEKEAKTLFLQTAKVLAANKKKVIICPPVLFIKELASHKGPYIKLGLQNTSIDSVGAYTGQVSFAQAKIYKILYSLVGHSESRLAGDTDEIIAKKILHTVTTGGTPILCVGEKARDESHQYFETIQYQIETAISLLSKTQIESIMIAYEPVWAIGKNAQREATPEEFYEIKIFIKKLLTEKYKLKTIPPILYGGSVTPKNSSLFLVEGQADGLLVGRASLDIKEFETIIKKI